MSIIGKNSVNKLFYLFHIDVQLYVLNTLYYPERDDINWLIHSLGYLKDKNVNMKTRNVIRETLDKDEIHSIPLAKRVY